MRGHSDSLVPELHARGVSRFSEERRGIDAIIRILPSAQVFLPGKTEAKRSVCSQWVPHRLTAVPCR